MANVEPEAPRIETPKATVDGVGVGDPEGVPRSPADSGSWGVRRKLPQRGPRLARVMALFVSVRLSVFYRNGWTE